MTTAIDTNVLIALWNPSDLLNSEALDALEAVYSEGKLVICGAVYAELLGLPGRTEKIIDDFLSDTGIIIDWTTNESIWRTAARAYQRYTKRRRDQKQPEPRRILTDFLVGAHALEKGHSLLTLDKRIFKAAFPSLKIVLV